MKIAFITNSNKAKHICFVNLHFKKIFLSKLLSKRKNIKTINPITNNICNNGKEITFVTIRRGITTYMIVTSEISLNLLFP